MSFNIPSSGLESDAIGLMKSCIGVAGHNHQQACSLMVRVVGVQPVTHTSSPPTPYPAQRPLVGGQPAAACRRRRHDSQSWLVLLPWLGSAADLVTGSSGSESGAGASGVPLSPGDGALSATQLSGPGASAVALAAGPAAG